ncbi:HAMP domain-containing protein [Endomicrobium proavitum]|uniref:HAMP domain-containing protein n=1 Tax=Endomicrobium proavitum TaxID=1408281 RepID=A0A0G3WIJ2_9BACT|nr:hypothetical protein [Endomicrobium proavitum]AKL98128.1 exported protein of unknown function [Endomicrobium proavitum]
MLRKKYLVKPKLQWRYFVILALIMAVLGVLGYYAFLNSLVSTPGIEQLSSGTIKSFKSAYSNGFFWVIFVFAAVVLVYSIFYFHRLIGPLFFFEKVMKKLSDGNVSMNVHWRKRDETKELAELIDAAIKSTRVSVLSDRKKVKEAIKAMDAKDTKKAKKLLQGVTKWCKTQ